MTIHPLVRLLVVEGIAFAAASIVHSGSFVDVSVDPGAQIAEGVIALVLFASALAAWLRPAWTRLAAGLAQGFGLVFSVIGLYLAVVGVGPNTIPDLVFHVVIVVMLPVGIVAALQATPTDEASSAGRAA